MSINNQIQPEQDGSLLFFYLFLAVLGLAAIGIVVYLIFS